jgi:hypothetical protein
MSDPRTKPTDGNPPAPILPRGTTPLVRRQRSPDERKVTAFRDWLANRDSDREKRLGVRAVHSGATSHDCEPAA